MLSLVPLTVLCFSLLVIVLSRTIFEAQRLGRVEEKENSIFFYLNSPLVDIAGISNVYSFVSSFILSNFDLWHHRLGHPSFVRLRSMNKELQFSNVDSSQSQHCPVCPLAKKRHLSFPFNNNLCPKPFDLIHVDIWRAIHVPTMSGHRYFLTIVDDSTRASWAYLLHSKSEVINIFPTF